MIVYEPPGVLALARRSRVRRRALAEFVAAAAARIPLPGQVSVLMTQDATIRALNRQFRKKDKATDVLSFPAAFKDGGAEEPLAGDLAISLETALRQAGERGHPLQTELQVLLLHGLLHLAGFDHEKDGGKMLRRERRLRREFGLPLGLIERSSGSAAPRASKASARGKENAGVLPGGAARRTRREGRA